MYRLAVMFSGLVALLPLPVCARTLQDAHNTLDVIWLVFCAGLVFFMQAGFCLVETGCIRKKNTLNVAIKNVSDMMVAILGYWAFGYALMFGDSWMGVIGSSGFALAGMSDSFDYAFFLFQAMFAGTAATIVSGAVAERMKFSGYLWVSVLLACCIYPVIGHWIWSETGWLALKGFMDFAGSTVVHSTGAWFALAGVMVLGPRKGRFKADGSPNDLFGHDLLLTTLGVFFLWFGWIGFNGGSLLAADGDIALVVINTVLAASAGGVANLVLSHVGTDTIRIERILNGVLGGLVAITAGCNVVSPVNAVIIGMLGGLIAHFSHLFLLHVLKLDDPVSAIPVHGFAGAFGTLAVALFAREEYLTSSRLMQVMVQLQGIGVTFVVAFGCGLLIFGLLKGCNLLRVSDEDEQKGLNIAEHGAKTPWLDTLQAMNKILQENDLTARVDADTGCEAGEVGQCFNSLMDSFADNIKQLQSLTLAVNGTAENLTSFSAETSKRLEVQSSSVVEIEESVEELRNQIGEVTQHMTSLVKTSTEVDAELGSSTQVLSMAGLAIDGMKDVIDKISVMIVSLDANAEAVGKVTSVISEIAEQTNLLALNAAIEAARAGESGKGFSVVADEVRKLSLKTKESTLQIRGEISSLMDQTRLAKEMILDGVARANNSSTTISMTGIAFNAIIEAVSGMKTINESLNNMVAIQQQASQSIHIGIQEISNIAELANSDVERLVIDGRSLTATTADVAMQLSKFKVVH